jgi:hypothetical protein
MEHALEYLDAQGTEWVKLDATDMGRPLYQKLGFADEAPIERWSREAGTAAPGARLEDFQTEEWNILDSEAFGADRSDLLRRLARLGAAAIPGQGFAMGREGSRAAYFGPCVSRSEESARELLRWFLARHPRQPVYWDLLPDNRAAAELAREFDFAPMRRLVRMVRKLAPGARPFTHCDSNVYAIAGFEYG